MPVRQDILNIIESYLSTPQPPPPQSLRLRAHNLENWAVRVAAVELLLRLPRASFRRPLNRWPLNVVENLGPAPGPGGRPAISFTVSAPPDAAAGSPRGLSFSVYALVDGTTAIVQIRVGGQVVTTILGDARPDGVIKSRVPTPALSPAPARP